MFYYCICYYYYFDSFVFNTPMKFRKYLLWIKLSFIGFHKSLKNIPVIPIQPSIGTDMLYISVFWKQATKQKRKFIPLNNFMS